MPLNIDNPEIEALVRKLAEKTGESVEMAVERSLQERLERLGENGKPRRLADVLDEIALSYAALPILDPREPDEILGYDENGLPT
jgi:antitoxin VapB